MKIVDTVIRVRYAETDQMGIVYHSNYIIWFEIGRTDWFRKIGQDYKSLEEKNILLPVIGVNCQYKKSALYDDLVIIRTYLKELKGVRLTFHYEVLREKDRELLAEGESQHAFVDRNQKPIALKKKFPEIWEMLKNNLE
ncbi:acyl-CoA thioesterase [Garciella nitratireducens]|uniref:Acyl-CoA thioester hydrolase n=1 Tax=Garciella nitratireducens DSM 15102 TaxID=1121911 RepID=A0A1T4NSX1_9FIRM|nr:thioesterase family protein [Garciella nitratireducens]RBP44750.1 acyl-CoA thioester hydrolase [Garciella nitratireducens]SJZ82136.1 acyl-CoA thioester hydrolase [Garciella nitratireducens DSM 15102]